MVTSSRSIRSWQVPIRRTLESCAEVGEAQEGKALLDEDNPQAIRYMVEYLNNVDCHGDGDSAEDALRHMEAHVVAHKYQVLGMQEASLHAYTCRLQKLGNMERTNVLLQITTAIYGSGTTYEPFRSRVIFHCLRLLRSTHHESKVPDVELESLISQVPGFGLALVRGLAPRTVAFAPSLAEEGSVAVAIVQMIRNNS